MDQTPRFLGFWAVNEPLDLERHRAQIDQFRDAGLDGVVFHPRNYPDEPEYLGAVFMQTLSRLILHTRDQGLAFWLYDENGWPSGTAGGETLRQRPELAQQWLGCFREPKGDLLLQYGEGEERRYLCVQTGEGVDYLHPELAPTFLRLTYERYRDGLDPEAFAHVEAFFSDEPEFGLGHAYDALPPDGALPWTADLPQLFAARYGVPLLPLLPSIFGSGAETGTGRVRFWELLGDCFSERFLKPMRDWCRAHGKLFTAHVKGEEHPLFQVPMVGSCSRVYQEVDLPAIDALERFPTGDFFPRQLSSSARQFGNGRCMAEAFGGAGWGAGPEDLERFLLWLGRHGVTDFVMHLAHAQLNGQSLRDWPPSHPFHLSWSRAYGAVLDKVRHQLGHEGRPEADTLVVSPHRAIMSSYQPHELLQTNVHNAASYPDSTAARINRTFLQLVDALQLNAVSYDVTDEATLERYGEVQEDHVQLGQQRYRRIVLAPRHQVKPALLATLPDTLLTAPDAWLQHPWQDTAVVHSRPVRENVFSIEWKLKPVTRNACLIDGKTSEDGRFRCAFYVEPEAVGAPLLLLLSDLPKEIRLNGHTLSDPAERALFEFPLAGKLCAGCNEVQAQFATCIQPLAWVLGPFLVQSDGPFESLERGMRRTSGPFRLAEYQHALLAPGELVVTGLPFIFEPVVAQAKINFVYPLSSLRFQGAEGAALAISVDGHEPQWLWGPDWTLERPIAPGPHEILAQLVPSSYNFYGPHHYVHGDHHVISPAQFSGRRNFADPLGTPENTLDGYWRFCPLRFPHSVVAISAEARNLIS